MQLNFKLAVIAAAVALAACGKKEEAAPAAPTAAPAAAAAPVGDNVIKIGHVGPTSGAIAHLGKDNENGARMAIEELNAANLTINDAPATFELLPEDDAGDPKQGVAAAQKLIDAKVAGVIGHLNSGTTIPASQLYNDAGIPQISPSATNPKYTRQGFTGAFRVVADDVQLGSTLGKYAVETLKATNVAVIDDRTAYGQGVADEFEKSVKAAGGNIVGREFTNDKASDFNAILTTLKAKKPDVIFFGGMDAVAGPMMKQMKSLGINAKFMGGDGICTSELVKLAGDGMADGQVVCAEAGGVEGEEKVAMDMFRADFKTKYGAEVQVYAPYVYDAVKIMAAAMVAANSSDPVKYLPELKKIQHKGVTGTVAFDEKGDIKNGALTLMTYQGGVRTPIAVIR